MPDAARCQRGFTLIEVLIATTVLALTMGAFLAGGARYADHARYIHDKTLAQWVARNQLVEYTLAETWPDTGEEDGTTRMGERNWHWEADIQESPDPNVRRIDLRVYRIDRSSGEPQANSVALLSGFLTPRREAANAPSGETGADGAADSDASEAQG